MAKPIQAVLTKLAKEIYNLKRKISSSSSPTVLVEENYEIVSEHSISSSSLVSVSNNQQIINDNLIKNSLLGHTKSTVLFPTSINRFRFTMASRAGFLVFGTTSDNKIILVPIGPGLGATNIRLLRFGSDYSLPASFSGANALENRENFEGSSENISSGDRVEADFSSNEKLVIRKFNNLTALFEDYCSINLSTVRGIPNFRELRFGFVSEISGQEKVGNKYLTEYVRELKYATAQIKTRTVEKRIVDSKRKKAILLVAGQSNAVGYDESPVNGLLYKENTRLIQLGFKGNDNLKFISLGHCAQSFQDMTPFVNPNSPNLPGTKGIHYPLAKRLLANSGSDEYDICVISACYGGTGFNSGSVGTYNSSELKPSAGVLKWSSTSPYYLAMRDRVKYVLDLNPENIFLGCIWIQGENDANNADTHKTAFEQMTSEFFGFFNQSYSGRTFKGTWDKDLWYNVESSKEWRTTGQYPTILQNYRSWNPNTYVEIPTDTSTNAVNGTRKTSSRVDAHFGGDSYFHTVSRLVFDKMISNGVIVP